MWARISAKIISHLTSTYVLLRSLSRGGSENTPLIILTIATFGSSLRGLVLQDAHFPWCASRCRVLQCARPMATTIGRALRLQESGAKGMMPRWTQPLVRGANTVVQCRLEPISAPLKNIYLPRPILQSLLTDGGSTSGKWIIEPSRTHQVRTLPTELIRMKWRDGKLKDGLIPFRDLHHDHLPVVPYRSMDYVKRKFLTRACQASLVRWVVVMLKIAFSE